MHKSVPTWCLALLILLPLIGGSLQSVRADVDPSVRAVWADAFHSGFKSTSQISSLVSRAQSGHYNVIIAEVLAYHDTSGDGHGAYWTSSIVPKATDITGGIDPLAYLVSTAHAAGIEVHAWIVPYRVSTAWPPSGNSLLTAHPEWLMVSSGDMGGGPATIDGKYVLDPGSPEAQEYIVSIVQELVTNYAIDGINFDYIRYTQTDAGYPAYTSYTASSLARFQDLTGYSGTPAPSGVTAWNDFRRQTINELVRRSRAEIASITTNPQQPVWFTADLITFGNAPSDFTSTSAYTLHQNWKYWLEQGWLDAGVPMNYKREFESDEALWYRNWVNAALNWSYDRYIIAGQANYLNTMADSVTQLNYSLTAGTEGTCNYSYYATADSNKDGNWENDWTWYTYVASNLFTTTVSVPALPWRDPATADEGTLWGRMFNETTGEPLDGATVQVGALPAVETDGNGYYVVTLIPANIGGSTYAVSGDSDDCAEVTVPDVVVLPGEVVWQDINLCPPPVGPGDMDEDGDIDMDDLPYFAYCMAGPGTTYISGHFCLNGDADEDHDVDLADFSTFQTGFTGP